MRATWTGQWSFAISAVECGRLATTSPHLEAEDWLLRRTISFLITDDGTNIARIARATGNTLGKYEIASVLGEGFGLGYIPLTNELIATNGTDEIYSLKLSSDFSKH